MHIYTQNVPVRLLWCIIRLFSLFLCCSSSHHTRTLYTLNGFIQMNRQKCVAVCLYQSCMLHSLAIATQFAMHGLALTGETRNYERTNKRKKAYSINNRNKNSAHIQMNAKRLNISMDLCWSRIIVCI